ncbi:MAG: hypothetical protein Q9201_005628 [Fulgogasparrea decipioides]
MPIDNTVPKANAAEATESPSITEKQPAASSGDLDEENFETFYLKQVTTEFADDLDKLRNASDFHEKSVPVLIDALKGTSRIYSEEEKAKVMAKGHDGR